MSTALARRKHNEIKLIAVRSLTTADLELLRGRASSSIGILTRGLRDRHHRIAYLIALGRRPIEVAAECHISPERVRTLCNAPAMQDLITKYRAEVEAARIEALQDFGSKAGRTMALAEGLITDQLVAAVDGTGPTPSLRDLNNIAVTRMDRFGYGKQSTNVNVNLDFADKLEAAIARSRGSNPKVIGHA